MDNLWLDVAIIGALLFLALAGNGALRYWMQIGEPRWSAAPESAVQLSLRQLLRRLPLVWLGISLILLSIKLSFLPVGADRLSPWWAVLLGVGAAVLVLAVLLRVSVRLDGERPELGLAGGRQIGILERIMVFGSLLAGVPEGVALALAIKGLGRYAELAGEVRAKAGGSKVPLKAEQFIIGTFASFLWAGGWAVLGRWVLTL